MKEVRLDEETGILHVDGVVAVVDGKHTPEFLTYLQFRLAYVDSEIARWAKDVDLWEWAMANPKQCSLQSGRALENRAHASRVLANLRNWRESLVSNIAWMTIEIETPVFSS